MTGYCMKCRESRDIQDAQQVTMKNGRPGHARKMRRLRHHDIQDWRRFLKCYDHSDVLITE